MNTQFKVVVRGTTLLIPLESENRGIQTFVKTNVYRPAVCTEHQMNPNSPIAAAYIGDINLVLKEEFEADLANQVAWINRSQAQPSVQVFFDACCTACQQHIARCGRLFIGDMFSYLDVFASLINSYFHQTRQQTTQIYLDCTKVLGHTLNQYVKCPGAYGVMMNFDTWANKCNI